MNNSSDTFTYLLKYIIIGDSGVGKSNILLRYIHNNFCEGYHPTIGVEFGSKNIELNDKVFKIQIWDTAGQENFRSITSLFFKNCACAVITYDVTNRESFTNVQKWIDDCLANSPKTISLVLVGNKSDLDEKRVIKIEEGIQYAKEKGINFIETSAKTGLNIEEIFTVTAKEVAKRIDEGEIDLESEDCGIKLGKYDPLKKISLDKDNSARYANWKVNCYC